MHRSSRNSRNSCATSRPRSVRPIASSRKPNPMRSSMRACVRSRSAPCWMGTATQRPGRDRRGAGCRRSRVQRCWFSRQALSGASVRTIGLAKKIARVPEQELRKCRRHRCRHRPSPQPLDRRTAAPRTRQRRQARWIPQRPPRGTAAIRLNHFLRRNRNHHCRRHRRTQRHPYRRPVETMRSPQCCATTR